MAKKDKEEKKKEKPTPPDSRNPTAEELGEL